MPASKPCSGECSGTPRDPLSGTLSSPLLPVQVRRSGPRRQDDGECCSAEGHSLWWWSQRSSPPCVSQLDALCAAAQALRALRSPGANLLTVLASAVEVRGWSPRMGGTQVASGAALCVPAVC